MRYTNQAVIAASCTHKTLGLLQFLVFLLYVSISTLLVEHEKNDLQFLVSRKTTNKRHYIIYVLVQA